MKHVLPIFLVVAIGAIIASVALTAKNQSSNVSAAKATVLTLSPSQSQVTIGQTVTVAVQIQTNTNEVVGSEMYINFDNQKLEFVSAQDGGFISDPVKVGPTVTGNMVMYSVFANPGTPTKQGSGTMANLVFRAKASGNASLTFGSSTLVVATNESGANVLLSANGTSIQVQGTQTASPTATARATATPTASPSPTPTQSPSPSPTATVRASATPTATATSTASIPPCILRADINDDSEVNLLDFGIFIDNFGSTHPADTRTDVNGDNKVNLLDYIILFEEYGKSCPGSAS
jgi:hypothetical protein